MFWKETVFLFSIITVTVQEIVQFVESPLEFREVQSSLSGQVCLKILWDARDLLQLKELRGHQKSDLHCWTSPSKIRQDHYIFERRRQKYVGIIIYCWTLPSKICRDRYIVEESPLESIGIIFCWKKHRASRNVVHTPRMQVKYEYESS